MTHSPHDPAQHVPGHSAVSTRPAVTVPEGVSPDEVWDPGGYEPARPGDFVEYGAIGFEVKRSRPVLRFLLCLVLLAAVAGGAWWWYHRSHPSTQLDAAQACRQVDAGAAAAGAPFLHVRAGGTLPVGIPLPPEKSWLSCQASSPSGFSGELLVWRTTSETDYQTLLAAGGWIASRQNSGYTVWISGTDRRMIVTATVDRGLVAFYRN